MKELLQNIQYIHFIHFQAKIGVYDKIAKAEIAIRDSLTYQQHSTNDNHSCLLIIINFSDDSYTMVRTKGDGGAARTVASKAPRKALGGSGASAAASRAISNAGAGAGGASPGWKYSGGNSYCPQPTPGWQQGINSFFKRDPNAPPPKMKDDEDMKEEEEVIKASEEKGKGKGKGKRSSKKKVAEDEENEPPNKKDKDEDEGEATKEPQKNGIIDSDSD